MEGESREGGMQQYGGGGIGKKEGTRGTPAFGKRHQKTHTLCRRCGKATYHKQKLRCAACGYPDAKMRRYDGWGQKVRDRKGQGTGRMRYMKTIARRAKNGFRSGTQAQPKVKAASN
ncbi:hypothetical protein ABPG73_019955 [Tetrahymena malaccensis]